MTFPIDRVREAFPALREGAAHSDAPGGSLVPAVVAAAVRDTLESAVCQRGSVTVAERRTDHERGTLLYVDGVHFTPHACVACRCCRAGPA